MEYHAKNMSKLNKSLMVPDGDAELLEKESVVGWVVGVSEVILC